MAEKKEMPDEPYKGEVEVVVAPGGSFQIGAKIYGPGSKISLSKADAKKQIARGSVKKAGA